MAGSRTGVFFSKKKKVVGIAMRVVWYCGAEEQLLGGR
jgi:hypothetical protein